MILFTDIYSNIVIKYAVHTGKIANISSNFLGRVFVLVIIL